jgi:hypothetical protein
MVSMSGTDPVENALPSSPDQDTLLVISAAGSGAISGSGGGLGQMLYQARGLTQTLALAKQASVTDRTINGKLVNLSPQQMRKYVTTISTTAGQGGGNNRAPPLENLFPGMEVQIDCACALAYQTGMTGCPTREAVDSYDTASGYTIYRPSLLCLIIDVALNFDEWGNSYGFTITAEEI